MNIGMAHKKEMERVNVEFLFGNLLDLTWQHVVMWCIGGLLIYLAIAKDMEPTLLLPIGFGTLLVNIPNVDLIQESGALVSLFNAGIANELFPLILFIGIGAMIDFASPAFQPEADDLRRGGTVRHLLHAVRGVHVL